MAGPLGLVGSSDMVVLMVRRGRSVIGVEVMEVRTELTMEKRGYVGLDW